VGVGVGGGKETCKIHRIPSHWVGPPGLGVGTFDGLRANQLRCAFQTEHDRTGRAARVPPPYHGWLDGHRGRVLRDCPPPSSGIADRRCIHI